MSTAIVAGPLHAHTTNATGYVLACKCCKDVMKMRYRETCDSRQHYAIERFVNVVADVTLYIIYAF